MLIFSAVLIFISLCGLAAFIFHLRHYAEQPAGLEPNDVVVDIPAGQPFKTTSQTLFKRNIIDSPFKFNLVARLKGYDKRLKAGEYSLCACMSPLQILEKLVKGEVKLYKLTIPEGLNIHQIAELIAEAGFSDKSNFIEAATNADLARKYGIDADSFEGYLFPETYYFPKNCRKSPPRLCRTRSGVRFSCAGCQGRGWSLTTPRAKNNCHCAKLTNIVQRSQRSAS